MAAQNDEVKIGIPYRSNEEITSIALDILTESGWEDGKPVDVEAICEKHFKLSLIPIYQLKNYHGVDAFVTSDFRIMVDQALFEEDSPRYRFSLAHELAHVVLHADAYREIGISSIQDHLSVQNRFSRQELKKIEQQAYRFAGCLLLPRTSFGPLVDEYFTQDKLRDMTIIEASAAVEEIASKYRVSKDVVQKQLMHFHPKEFRSLTQILDY